MITLPLFLLASCGPANGWSMQRSPRLGPSCPINVHVGTKSASTYRFHTTTVKNDPHRRQSRLFLRVFPSFPEALSCFLYTAFACLP